MLILIFFALLSGVVTILSPCVWAMLPVVLSSSTLGGKYRALGIATGIALCFGLSMWLLGSVANALSLDRAILKPAGVGIIALFGLILLIPPLEHGFDRLMSRVARLGRRGPALEREGWWGGLFLGVALGGVWTPCASPILFSAAALLTTEAQPGLAALLVASYVVGMALPLFVLTLLGQRLFQSARFLAPYTGLIRRVFGCLLLLAAWMFFTDYHLVLQAKLVGHYPVCAPVMQSLDTNPTFLKALRAIQE